MFSVALQEACQGPFYFYTETVIKMRARIEKWTKTVKLLIQATVIYSTFTNSFM